MRPRRSCAAYHFPYTFMEHCLLPPPCANLFLQHLGSSTVTAKSAQHSAFFIPAAFLFLLARFFFPCPHSVFFFSQHYAAAVRRGAVSAWQEQPCWRCHSWFGAGGELLGDVGPCPAGPCHRRTARSLQ